MCCFHCNKSLLYFSKLDVIGPIYQHNSGVPTLKWTIMAQTNPWQSVSALHAHQIMTTVFRERQDFCSNIWPSLSKHILLSCVIVTSMLPCQFKSHQHCPAGFSCNLSEVEQLHCIGESVSPKILCPDNHRSHTTIVSSRPIYCNYSTINIIYTDSRLQTGA